MFSVAFWSAWAVWLHDWQRKTAWLTRFSAAVCPHRAHRCEVRRASTSTITRPALAALARSTSRNTPHPASRIDRLRPALAATLVPGACGVPAAERVMLAIRSASCAIRSWSRTSFRAVLCAKSRRWRRIFRCTPATRSLALHRRLEPRWHRDSARCALVSRGADAARYRGAGMSVPSLVVRNDATPMSIPDRAGSGKRLSRHAVARQHHIPAAALTRHRNCLDRASHQAVLAHLDLPDALQPDPGLPAAGSGIPAAAIAVPGPFHRVEPAAPLEPRVTRLLPGLDAAEERGERLVQPAQGGLLGAERPAALPARVSAADVLQVRGLLTVPDRHPRALVGGLAVLQRGVVKLPVILHHPRQRRLLFGGWAEQELIRPPHRAHSLRRGRPSRMPVYGRTAAAQPNALAKAARWCGRNSRRQLYREPISKVYSIIWPGAVIPVLIGEVRRSQRMSLHEQVLVI